MAYTRFYTYMRLELFERNMEEAIQSFTKDVSRGYDSIYSLERNIYISILISNRRADRKLPKF